MKRLLQTALFFFFCSPCYALELSKTVTHENGWSYHFSTVINNTTYPIELPYAKCEKTDISKSCFATEREAYKYAHTKALAAEKMMKEALTAKPPHTK